MLSALTIRYLSLVVNLGSKSFLTKCYIKADKNGNLSVILLDGNLRNNVSFVINWSILVMEILFVSLLVFYDIFFGSTVKIQHRIQIYPVILLTILGAAVHARLISTSEMWDVLYNVLKIHQQFKKLVTKTDDVGHYMKLYMYNAFCLSAFVGMAAIYSVASEIHFLKYAKILVQFIFGPSYIVYLVVFFGVGFVMLVNIYFVFYILVALLTLEEASLLLQDNLSNEKRSYSPVLYYRTSQLLTKVYFEASKYFTSFLVGMAASLMIVLGSCLVICAQLCGFSSDVSAGVIFLAAFMFGKIIYSAGESLTATGIEFQNFWSHHNHRIPACQRKAIKYSQELKIPVGNFARLSNSAFVALIQDVVFSKIVDISLAYG